MVRPIIFPGTYIGVYPMMMTWIASIFILENKVYLGKLLFLFNKPLPLCGILKSYGWWCSTPD